MFKRLTDWLTYLVVRVFICLVQSVRFETCQDVCKVLAQLATVLGIRRGVLRENLGHVFPGMTVAEHQRFVRRMWEHLFLMVCEIAHVPRKIHETNWRRYVTVRGKRDLVRYLLDPRPTVVVSGHYSNFEVGGYLISMLGFPQYSIARPLDNPYLDRFVNRFRQLRGQFILPKTGSAKQVDAVLAAGRTLSLLGDQNAGPKGCFVDFFGRPASCHKAIAVFTLVSGAPLLVAYVKRRERPLQFDVGLVGVADPREPAEHLAGVKPLTQWYNQMLERLIRSDAEQYWWVHRRWKHAPVRREKKTRVDVAEAQDGPHDVSQPVRQE